MTKQYFVYIVYSRTRIIYIGVTNNLDRRLYEHKNKIFDGYSSQYETDSLVYYEVFSDVKQAIAREKQIKKWRREKKDALIEVLNPDWDDLSTKWKR